ncbi:unnamed protein product [Pseudo-nitzschia multistriata]|uniref:Uncharacterized protein n=1 Tax=Pseudo-nitzschia multistriata TaxID=183589 RepID=A0A448YUQ6_9STRA|nr:unnamed protein product [Pseudo-nitzschia multistriata]
MSNKNAEVSKSEESFSWTRDGKILSKNLLYTPLVAYQKALLIEEPSTSTKTEYHPSHYMLSRKSVPKSLQESSLVSLFHSVSCDYHRNRAGVNDAKNNGSRPMGLSDIEEKIRQRAIALIGGGINSSISVSQKPPRSKKRRQRSWEEKNDVLDRFSSSSGASKLADVVPFLERLNAAWNEYIWELLVRDRISIDSRNVTGDTAKEIRSELSRLTWPRIDSKILHSSNVSSRNAKEGIFHHPFEIIGSHVQIKSCKSHRSWSGRFGVVVGETTNTYRIAGFVCRKNKKRARRKKSDTIKARKVGTSDTNYGNSEVEALALEQNASHDFKEKRNDKADSGVGGSDALRVEVFLLPKLGSSFQLIIPLPFNQAKQKNANESKTVDTDCSVIPDSIISVPTEAIGISITEPSQAM